MILQIELPDFQDEFTTLILQMLLPYFQHDVSNCILQIGLPYFVGGVSNQMFVHCQVPCFPGLVFKRNFADGVVTFPVRIVKIAFAI